MNGKGALKDKYDIRDYHYQPSAGGGNLWDDFDIEEVIGHKLTTKDQKQSFSCGGQAWSYYMEVLEAVATKDYEPRSARWIYSQTWQEGGGSFARDNSRVCKEGIVREELVSSYPATEEHLRDKPEITPEIEEDKEINRALSYLIVSPELDIIADAIKKNYGVVLGINGQDNGTWRSKYPKEPVQTEWRHWVYAGKIKVIDGVKYIGIKNSWGNVGDNGWQWLSESYFTSGNVWAGWTLQWDYEPPLRKKLLIQTIKLIKQLMGLLVNKK